MSAKTVFLQMIYDAWEQALPLANALMHVILGFVLGRWR